MLSLAGAAGRKRGVYGNVHVAPHGIVVLRVVVEHAGALGKEAKGLFQRCRKIAVNQLSPHLDEVSTWSQS